MPAHPHPCLQNLCCPGEARPGSPVLQPVRCRASSPDFMTWGPALLTTQQFRGTRKERASPNTHSPSCKLLLYEGKHQASSSFWPQLQYGDSGYCPICITLLSNCNFSCQQRTFPKFFRCNPPLSTRVCVAHTLYPIFKAQQYTVASYQ